MDKINDTTYHSNNLIHGIEVEIGDIKQSDFLPQIKLKKWNNEVNFSVRHITDGIPIEHRIEDGKVKHIYPKHEAHFYEKKVDFTHEHLKDKVSVDYLSEVTHHKSEFEHLKIGDRIIARDSEEERKIRRETAKQAHGDVLVVGLGLGVINEYLGEQVSSVTVVEISQPIINLVQKLHPKILENTKLICADFYDFAKITEEKFDFIYGDIFPFFNRGNIDEWSNFVEVATPLLKEGGIVDGRPREQYELNQVNSITDTGMEFELLLKEKPDSNIFRFSIDTKQLDFCYQPPLDPKEGFRAESIVGSYAVYHKDKTGDFSQLGGHNYLAGKVTHIYRPKIFDSTDKWVWGELNIDTINSELTITCPQSFIDDGVYPLLVDPTFGYTTIGASNSGILGNTNEISSQFLGAVGTGTSISVGFFSNAATVGHTAGLYTLSGTTLTLVSGTGTVTDSSLVVSSFVGLNFNSAPTLSAINYNILAMIQAGSKSLANMVVFDAGTTNQGAINTNFGTYPTLPSSIAATLNNNKYSIFVTYTATGTSVSPLSILGAG